MDLRPYTTLGNLWCEHCRRKPGGSKLAGVPGGTDGYTDGRNFICTECAGDVSVDKPNRRARRVTIVANVLDESTRPASSPESVTSGLQEVQTEVEVTISSKRPWWV